MLEIRDKDLKLIQGAKVFRTYQIINNSDIEIPKKVYIEISNTLQQDLVVFTILKNIKGYLIENCEFEIVYSGGDTKQKIILVVNNSMEFTIRNCKVRFNTSSQVSFTALLNNGGLDTKLETQADGLSVENCRFSLFERASSFNYECKVCAIENILANSISISNSYIFSQINGNGEKQKAYGIINSGRFVRIENNNIKANGTHNMGNLLEQSYTYGVYNTGLYLIFTGNNCVGEWGGKCVGLYNGSSYANITGNKILATHTVCGRAVILAGAKNILANNILTSTSLNQHIVEITSGFNKVSGNHIESLMGGITSGVGIFIEGKQGTKVTNCMIFGNQIVAEKDYGIVMQNTENNKVSENTFFPLDNSPKFIPIFHCGKDILSREDLANNPSREAKDLIYLINEKAIISIQT